VSDELKPVDFPLREAGSEASGWIGMGILCAISIFGIVYIYVWGPGWTPSSLLMFVSFGMVFLPVFIYRNYVHPRVDLVDGALVIYNFFDKDVVPVDQVTALLGDRFLVVELVDGSRVALEPLDLAFLPTRPWVGPRVHAQQIELLKSVLNVP